MDILTFMVVAAKCKNLFSVTECPGAFLNINVKDDLYIITIYTYLLIVTAKSAFAAYSARCLVPKYLTTATIFASIIYYLFYLPYDNISLIIAYYIAALISTFQNYDDLVYSFFISLFAASENYFHFLLDVFTVISSMFYAFKFYEKECEKAFTLICMMFCLDWYIDSYQGKSPLNIVDVTVTFMFLILSFVALKPLRRNSNISYLLIWGTLLIWLSYKYHIIASTQGLSEHLFEYPPRNWNDEIINAIEIYVYDLLRFYDFHIPFTKKFVSSVVLTEVKRKEYVTSIELYHLNKSLPSFKI